MARHRRVADRKASEREGHATATKQQQDASAASVDGGDGKWRDEHKDYTDEECVYELRARALVAAERLTERLATARRGRRVAARELPEEPRCIHRDKVDACTDLWHEDGGTG